MGRIAGILPVIPNGVAIVAKRAMRVYPLGPVPISQSGIVGRITAILPVIPNHVAIAAQCLFGCHDPLDLVHISKFGISHELLQS